MTNPAYASGEVSMSAPGDLIGGPAAEGPHSLLRRKGRGTFGRLEKKPARTAHDGGCRGLAEQRRSGRGCVG